MKRKLIPLFIGALLLSTLTAVAQQTQPKARAAREEAKSNTSLSVRAQNRYPRSRELPQDVVWMREIYRTLDLMKEDNGALYYPIEPMGEKLNLFTLLFRLLAEKKIPAYDYQLDGTERLTPDAQLKFRDLLDRFQIYHELRKVKDRRDSVLVIENSDIPSAAVLSYFVKEVWYFDQRTSEYGSQITAICPVVHRTNEFSSVPTKLPMCWIDYKDLAPYLSGTSVSTSNLNNAANRNIDDFFTARLYSGDIYKTTNLQNRVLSQYCPTDSAMTKEQQRIEAELVSFEKSLYGTDAKVKIAKSAVAVAPVEPDSAATASPATPIEKEQKQPTVRNSKKKGSNKSVSTPRQSSSKREAAAPKASVRRQRR